MSDKDKLADLPADVTVSPPERLAKAYRDYERYHATLAGADGKPVEQQRDILRAGQVVAVVPVDLERDEIVLIRQFRLPAHLGNGRGELSRPSPAGSSPAKSRARPRSGNARKKSVFFQPSWLSCSVISPRRASPTRKSSSTWVPSMRRRSGKGASPRWTENSST